jgi:uncharacterized ferritin-like protein (DUF455 family)
MPDHVRSLAYQAFCQTDPSKKIKQVYALNQRFKEKDGISINPSWQASPEELATPAGYPALQVVHPARVPKRGFQTEAGQAALIHAIAHIEFNAINLALDAVWRFADLPEAFYRDWLAVAVEEAQHFELLTPCLQKRGFTYGDLPVHEGLWEMAERTKHSVIERMALVPRVLEARGLDVTPAIIQKLTESPHKNETRDLLGALKVILREEEAHVQKGNAWYLYFCQQQHIADPHQHFMSLCQRYAVKPPRPPFNQNARLACGFTVEELNAYQNWYEQQTAAQSSTELKSF